MSHRRLAGSGVARSGVARCQNRVAKDDVIIKVVAFNIQCKCTCRLDWPMAYTAHNDVIELDNF
jgi:hypothetical protein